MYLIFMINIVNKVLEVVKKHDDETRSIREHKYMEKTRKIEECKANKSKLIKYKIDKEINEELIKRQRHYKKISRSCEKFREEEKYKEELNTRLKENIRTVNLQKISRLSTTLKII